VSFDRQPVLIGELLELRPLAAEDFGALFRVAADPLIWEQHPECDRYQETTFRAFFEEALSSGGALVAVDRVSGQIIGSSRYHGHDATRSVIEIGWSFLARAYWGGRYNGEMKRLMLEHAFRWVNRVLFIIGPENRRSKRAVEKIGGVRAGTTTDAHGRERIVYELTPELYARKHEPGSDRLGGLSSTLPIPREATLNTRSKPQPPRPTLPKPPKPRLPEPWEPARVPRPPEPPKPPEPWGRRGER
jgi:RimJ/RimL family protein N-acetyltransferase